MIISSSPIPHLSSDTHTLRISGVGIQRPITLTIPELQTKFRHATIVAALQCAGNRRHEMRTQLREVNGIDWTDGAVSNIRWKGPRLRDVLLRAGVHGSKDDSSVTRESGSGKDQVHVAFACNAVKVQEDDWYGSSIPLTRVMNQDADIILAIEMNGALLTPSHGAPLRVIAPGLVGARSVKWLDTITLQTQESTNHYQRRDYKVLPADAISKEAAEKYWDVTPALMDMPVNSAIGSPTDEEEVSLQDGFLIVKGYALPQGDQGPVTKVEVRVGEKGKWMEAEMVSPHEEMNNDEAQGKWAWKLWRARISKQAITEAHGNISTQGSAEKQGTCTVDLFSRATDAGGNTQSEGEWNLRGVAYNGFGSVRAVKVAL